MPQMAPLSWLNLFIYFIMVFMFFNSLNYFFYNKSSISQEKKNLKKMISSSWKW
uniref:ATP synthase F0 subunit 8 n=1 Tax=Rhagonycha nigroimpressa TaxID=3027144 RepID=UPI0023D7F6A7|nr:ATP synthase F0 subunit 8 [Rhagonycha nigroimpressa]WCS40137.1 ATP synthase F0 subunit 8 [Rhagonycha nigroimpressa]WRO44848.1 ATP synthase F0 subunit 8 [Rhagonycha nigroimpressa]